MSIEHDLRKPTLASLEASQAESNRIASERESRINACDVEASDCCLSMWASDSMLAKRQCQIDLARNGWKHDFMVLHKNGKPVSGKVIETKFGFRWLIDGKFYPTYGTQESPRKAANFAKAGFTWVQMTLDAHVAQSFGSYVGAPVSSFPAADDRNLIVASVG